MGVRSRASQGLIGVVAKPVTGVLDGATSVTTGIMSMATVGTAAAASSALQRRRRPARLTWGVDRLLIAVTPLQVRQRGGHVAVVVGVQTLVS